MTGWRFVKTSSVATRCRCVCPGIRWHIRLNTRGLENVVPCPSTRWKPYLTRPMPKSENSLRQGRRARWPRCETLRYSKQLMLLGYDEMSWRSWILRICTTIPKLNSGDVMRLCMCDGARPPAAVHLDVVLFCSCQNSIGGYRVCGSGWSKLAIGLIQEPSMLSGSPSDGLASLGVILIAGLPSFAPKLGCRKS